MKLDEIESTTGAVPDSSGGNMVANPTRAIEPAVLMNTCRIPSLRSRLKKRQSVGRSVFRLGAVPAKPMIQTAENARSSGYKVTDKVNHFSPRL